MTDANTTRRSTLLVFLSSVFFATGGLFFKIITWDALAIGGARSIISLTVLVIYLAFKKHKYKFTVSSVVAALSVAATNTLYSIANKLTTAGNTIVLQFSMPAFVIVIMLVWFHKKPTKLELVTCFAVLAGIVCFFVDSLSAGNMLGNALALLSGITYALYFIFSSREDSEPFTAVVLGSVITSLIGIPSLLRTDILGTPWPMLLAVLALGVVQQGMAKLCFSAGIQNTPAVAAGLLSGFEPVLNPILVAVFYHEYLSPLSIVGAVIVLGAIVFYNYRAARDNDAIQSAGES